MKKDPHDLERLNKMISPYQGPGWAATSRPEKERMLRAQSRKRRQITSAVCDQMPAMVETLEELWGQQVDAYCRDTGIAFLRPVARPLLQN